MTDAGAWPNQAVLDELARCFKRAGRGSIARVQRDLEVNRNYFKDWQAGRAKVDLSMLERALEVLEVDPLLFFMRALTYGRDLQQYEILETLEGPSLSPSPFIAAIRGKAESEGLD